MDCRLATHDDISDIIVMKLAMFQEAGVEMGASNEKLIALYNRYYDECSAFHFIVEEDDRVVAMAGGFLKDDFPFCLYPNPIYGFIGDVYVRPSHRRKGYAKVLSNKIIRKLKQDGVKTVRLLASEAAKPLYEQLGFEQADMMAMQIK